MKIVLGRRQEEYVYLGHQAMSGLDAFMYVDTCLLRLYELGLA